MNDFEKELKFLLAVLKRSRIDYTFSSGSQAEAQLDALNIESYCKRCIYLMDTPFHLHFIVICIPSDELKILVIGPYMTELPSDTEIEETAKKLSLGEAEKRNIVSLFPDIIKLSEASMLLNMVSVLASSIWPDGDTRTVIIRSSAGAISRSIEISSGKDAETGLEEYRMEMMLQRYESENKLMELVMKGDKEAAEQAVSSFSASDFDRRNQNPVYNSRNYAIIFNTIMRKAAENGGVHPIYIDRLSSAFAFKIDGAATTEGVIRIMKEIPPAYAELVRKHSYAGYTSPIESVLIRIDTALTSDLSLPTLAKISNLSESRLSARFREEVGISITKYIEKARYQEACRLLEKGISIEETAQRCGCSSIHYFSRFFKKMSGQSPGRYAAKYRKQ